MKFSINHISKAYFGKTVLTDCSYDFDKKGTYVLMGPNGCGKSTLLRICALIEEPSEGAVSYSDGNALLPHDIGLKRRITVVLPRIGLFNTTVFNNVAYGLRIRGVQRDEIGNRVQKALCFVGLEHKIAHRALTLSSGEAQRLGIARALAVEPEILFLDEPTASVDEENTEIVESIILAMKKGGRSTVIMTTHDRAQAERIGDGLISMKHGFIANNRSSNGGPS